MGYQTVEIRKLTPDIGAEIVGIDLSQPLGDRILGQPLRPASGAVGLLPQQALRSPSDHLR